MKSTDKKSPVTNPVFDSKLYALSFEIGGIYVQRGFNKYSDWSAQMIQSVGEEIKPWLSSIWEALKNIPEGSKFNEEQFSAFSKIIGYWIQEGKAKNYDETISLFYEEFEKEDVEKFEPVIKVAYAGIKKFFEENQIPIAESPKEEVKKMSKTPATNKKNNGKRKSSNRKTESKEEPSKSKKPSALDITYRKNMGLIELSESKAISVSLIRNALEQKFLAIEKISKTKSGEWSSKKDSGVWIPFHTMEKVGNLIAYAYSEGEKAGWANTYEPQPMTLPQGSVPIDNVQQPAIRELKLEVQGSPQIKLFDEDKARQYDK